MTLIIDPVKPWSHLWAFLSRGGPSVLLVAAVVGLVAFVLPIALQRPPGRFTRRQVGIAGVLALVLLLGYIERATWGMSGRLHGLWSLLLVLPMALAGVGVATYFSVPSVKRRRLLAVVGLRLLALLLTLLAILRPSLGFVASSQVRRQLFIALDYSRSMTIKDETGKRSRWEVVLRSLEESEPALQRLRDAGVEVVLVKFAGEMADFDLSTPGEADGKRTDVGTMMRTLRGRRDPRSRVLGLLVVTDGADNGTAVPPFGEAARWRTINQQLRSPSSPPAAPQRILPDIPCPVHAFACGRPTTTLRQNDVAITSISTAPQPFVPVKGKLTVKVTIDARGFENSRATVRLFLEGPDAKGEVKDREVQSKEVVLRETTGNEVEITCNAPARPGEVKVKVVVDTPDEFPLNNVIETFVTVSKEGISVLLVDKRRFERKRIKDALAEDARIRVTEVLMGGKPAGPEAAALFNFEEHPYDVIIIGDVTAKQMQDIDKDVLKKIEKQVAGGAGFLMMGGYASFGNGDWKGTEIEPILPVDLSSGGQEESTVRMVPTAAGLRLAPYLFRLDDNKDLKAAWEKLTRLAGMTLLSLPKPRRGIETVLATTEDPNVPLLIMQNYARPGKGGKGAKGSAAARVLAFGGDTTHRWDEDGKEESVRLHHRFWRQMVVWLARQEDAEGNVWVKPDVRRLPVRNDLGFAVGLRGKGGGPDLAGGKYKVEVTGPDGVKKVLPVATGRENRGTLKARDMQAAGVYKITVQGSGKDPSGGVVSGSSSARVIVYDEDLEMMRPAADHDFLRKLAVEGGGEFHRAEELSAFLGRLLDRPVERDRVRLDLRPDWRSIRRSPFLVVFFLLFVAAVSGEWLLRRRWGMV
jgi:hypothetical protein